MELTNQQLEEKLAFEFSKFTKGSNGTTKEDIVKPAYDVVSKPKHYMLFAPREITTHSYMTNGIEVRDVIEKLVYKIHGAGTDRHSPLFESDYVQMMQYLMRFMEKNGKEDLEKAKFYLDKLIQSY